MTKARNIADLLDANGDVKLTNLDNIDLTNLSATNLTSGTIPNARFPSHFRFHSGCGAVRHHSPAPVNNTQLHIYLLARSGLRGLPSEACLRKPACRGLPAEACLQRPARRGLAAKACLPRELQNGRPDRLRQRDRLHLLALHQTVLLEYKKHTQKK